MRGRARELADGAAHLKSHRQAGQAVSQCSLEADYPVVWPDIRATSSQTGLSAACTLARGPSVTSRPATGLIGHRTGSLQSRQLTHQSTHCEQADQSGHVEATGQQGHLGTHPGQASQEEVPSPQVAFDVPKG